MDVGVEPPLKRLWMGIPPGLRARYESLGELRFSEGLVPGTKPFKLVFAQREFPPELVRNKETCAMYESPKLFIPRFNIPATPVHVHPMTRSHLFL